MMIVLIVILAGFVGAESSLTPSDSSNIQGITCTSKDNACELGYTPITKSISMYDQGSYYWYHLTVPEGTGTVSFRLDIDTDDNDDVDLFVYDYTGSTEICRSTSGGAAQDESCSDYKDNPSIPWAYYLKIYNKVDGGFNGYSNVIIKVNFIECTRNSDCGLYEKCSNSQCVPQSCSEMGYTTCSESQEGDLMCGGSSNRERMRCWEFIEDETYCWMSLGECLSTQGCDDGYCYDYECMRNSDCSSTEKCSNHECVAKTCSDYSGNTGQSCNYYLDYLTGNTKCLSGNPVGCYNYEAIYCWKNLDACTSDEYCEDPVDSGAQCFPYPCTISSVSWDKTNALIGENVGITVQGSHCKSSDLVGFEIYEDDLGFKDNKAVNNPSSKYFSNNLINTNWVSEFFDDINGDPEFAAYAYYSGQEKKSSNLLTISCPDVDGDDYSPHGGVCGLIDCNDNNKNIYPGATEICNYHDDDCDGSTDEGFDLQNDKNNCGSCKNVCSSGYVCSTGECKGCGDHICSTEIGENPITCSNDCYGNLTITQITSAPTNVKQGQQVTVQVKIENKGTYSKTLSVEAGIVPDTWEGKAFTAETSEFGIQSSIPTESCCPGNNYYVAKNVTLNSGQSEYVSFTLYAPIPSSVDACNGLGSAWSSNTHKLIIGLYEKCGSDYLDSKVQNMKVYKVCNYQTDCPGEYCNFSSGYPGICKPKTCTNLCAVSGSYLCSGTELVQCLDTNADGCLDLKHIAYCSGTNICISGKSTCQNTVPKTKAQIEYAGLSTTVNKQKGDIVKLRLLYYGTETVTLSYNSGLFTSISCQNSFTITGDKDCLFEVTGTANNIDSNFGLVNGQQGKVRIITNPSTVIITDRKKLLERYGDKEEVDAMLKQAYSTAESQNGIVYDVSDYLTNNLWTKSTEYDGGAYALR